MQTNIINTSLDLPILLAGPTASGKSSLALEVSKETGRTIVNADALQVFDGWRVLTARPTSADVAQAPHALYGHVAMAATYSVGQWLREVEPLLSLTPAPIIVGGTGLYFRALTEGLAPIPAVSDAIRAEADRRISDAGYETLLAEVDDATRTRIDTLNPMRVQRAWEVLRATGRGLAAWQDETPAPLVPLNQCEAIVLDADKDWLIARITRRFSQMMDQGAIEEVQAIEPMWDPSLPSSKAIGAPELIAYLRGEISIDAAKAAAIISTRQYAKRQRTWFRARMKAWRWISVPE